MNASASVYPRDLRGHGADPPHARWPGGARIAVQFVLNYEEGGENNVLHGDAVSETFLSELVTAQAYENRHMTMESMYEYGSRVGVWRILREFDARKLPLTVFGVAMALERYPELVGEFMRRDHEIACHGLRWIHYQHMPEAAERRHLDIATRVLKELSGGAWPLGWYTGRDSPNTRRLVVEHGGYEYDSDYYGDDLPFWAEVEKGDGTQGAAPGRPLFARHQRHALRPGAGLQHRRALLHLPARRVRRPLRGRRSRRPRPAEDDVDRHALPPARQARPDRRAAPLPRPRAGARARLDRRGASTSPATGAPCTRMPASAAGDGARVA